MENTLGYELSNGGSIPSGRTINKSMSTYFKKLDLKVPFFNDHFDLKNVTRSLRFNTNEIISKELHDLISSLEIISKESLVIIYPKFTKNSVIHLDTHDVYDQANLNLVINANSSLVNWYLPKEEGYNGKLAYVLALKRDYEIDKMNLVESSCIEGMCLFQAGVPHNVTNLEGPRVCVNVRLKTANTAHLSWSDALIRFEKFII